MSRCVEKPFAPCWQCGHTRVFRPVPHRAVTAWGARVFCYGRAVFLSEQTECRSPVTGNWHSLGREAAGGEDTIGQRLPGSGTHHECTLPNFYFLPPMPCFLPLMHTN